MVDGHPRRNAQIIPVKSQRDNGANASPLRRKRRAITPCSSRHYTVIAMPQCRNGETAARLRRPRNPMNVCSKRRGRPLCRPLRHYPHTELNTNTPPTPTPARLQTCRNRGSSSSHHTLLAVNMLFCYYVFIPTAQPYVLMLFCLTPHRAANMFLCCSIFNPIAQPMFLCCYV